MKRDCFIQLKEKSQDELFANYIVDVTEIIKNQSDVDIRKEACFEFLRQSYCVDIPALYKQIKDNFGTLNDDARKKIRDNVSLFRGSSSCKFCI